MACRGCGKGRRATSTASVSKTNLGAAGSMKITPSVGSSLSQVKSPMPYQTASTKKSNRCCMCSGLVYKKQKLSKSLYLFECSVCKHQVCINDKGEIQGT